jgi:hypothetical protein
MSEFVPSGYISVREAENRLGKALFPVSWTGDEYKARSGLMSKEQWLAIKDLPPARGSGAPDDIRAGGTAAKSAPATVPEHEDPLSASYQKEYQASERHRAVLHQLRVWLEAGQHEAVVLDVFTGRLYPIPFEFWRRHNAGRMLEKQQAPIPNNANTGTLLIKDLSPPSQAGKPLSRPQIEKIIAALRKTLETEKLTRAQQQEFVRKEFPQYRITHRQFLEIFKELPIPKGRRKNSDKK